MKLDRVLLDYVLYDIKGQNRIYVCHGKLKNLFSKINLLNEIQFVQFASYFNQW